MRIDWVPFSASALVAGATALSIGAVLTPESNSTADTLRVVESNGGQWMAVAALYFFASVALTVGMPSVLTLFDKRGFRTGLTAVSIFTVGAVGIAGLAMLLAFLRALVVEDAIEPDMFEAVATETGFAIFLYAWIGAFYLGELLLGIALLRAGSTPRWIPGLLLAHVALFPLSSLLPERLASFTVLLITVAFAGVGIAANQRHARLPV
jgi:hypothetical protein